MKIHAPDGRNVIITTSGDGTRTQLLTSAYGGKITLTSDETFTMEGNAISKLGDIGGQVKPTLGGTS